MDASFTVGWTINPSMKNQDSRRKTTKIPIKLKKFVLEGPYRKFAAEMEPF